MAILVILVLVVLWAAVLLPPILRSRHASGHHGVSDFMHHLKALGTRGHSHRSNEIGGPVLHGPVGAPSPTPTRGSRKPIAGPVPYRPMPGAMSPMQRRRRNVLFGLVGAVAVTFLLAFVTRSMTFIALFLLAAVALGGYIYLLVQFKKRPTAVFADSNRVYATPVMLDEDESPKVGDNVVVLRRSVG